ncbi:tetratricopeptide repeat protein [Candidatus Similichlamydia epinepheli]|uniref:tetratricopeptide repeat protein n=1 Tax=Candidatus Similichlamydia epinepheli TaxID=1903953 RepID=UPI000D3C35FF|nr:tetratricopeptide repeat protein [Candidatus Similichlamydia epinepheli]
MTTELEQTYTEQYRTFLGGAGIDKGVLEKLIRSSGTKVSSDEAPSLSDLIGVIRALPPLYESIDLSEEKVESIYALGYQAYEQARYDDAVKYFRLAYLLDVRKEKYLFSLGLALEKNEQFFEATTAYQFWASFHPELPFGHFRTGICFLELNDNISAKSFFDKTLKLSKGRDDLTSIYERALLYVSGLEEGDDD